MTPSPTRPQEPCVLIVDHSDESREVLRTALQRRGVKTLDTAVTQRGLDLARQYHPDVIVLDIEAESGDDAAARAQLEIESNRHDGSIVVLGTVRTARAASTRETFVSKPYHYGPLIRTIEQLLEK